MFWSHEATLLRHKQTLLRGKESSLRDKQSLLCDEQSLLRDEQSLLRDKQSLLRDKQSLLRDEQSLPRDEQSLLRDKQSLLRGKQSLLRDKQTLLRGKATFLSYEEALLRRRNTYKHQPLNKRRTYHSHKTHPGSRVLHAPKRLRDRGNRRRRHHRPLRHRPRLLERRQIRPQEPGQVDQSENRKGDNDQKQHQNEHDKGPVFQRMPLSAQRLPVDLNIANVRLVGEVEDVADEWH